MLDYYILVKKIKGLKQQLQKRCSKVREVLKTIDLNVRYIQLIIY